MVGLTQRGKIDTRTLGLDLGAELIRFVTGRENLHYGCWDEGVEVCAGNLRQAQEAYSNKVKGCFPQGQLKILDVGGGCGEFAKNLFLDGHNVEIVVPSASLAARCRVNAGSEVRVHLARFEDFQPVSRFDLCLFSESFQYIPINVALSKAKECLQDSGEILISDCFRTAEFYAEFADIGLVGGGHSLADFRDAISTGSFETLHEEDITEAVAPSVDLEQKLYNMLGASVERLDRDLVVAFPFRRKLLDLAVRYFVDKRKLGRLKRRLFGNFRNAESFCRYNRYLILRLQST